MKIFIVLFFSGFVYAQQPQNNTDDSAQQNNKQGATQEQKSPKAPQAKKEEQKQTPTPPPAPSVEKQKPKSTKKEEQAPAEDKSKKSTPVAPTQMVNDSKTVTVPAQPLQIPPEEPIPYYNPLHPQSPSAYQEGDLPSEEVYDMTSSRKKRKHRFSVGGKVFDYHVQGNLKKISINASADYGYSHRYFEVGPYASVELNDFDTELHRFSEEAMFDLGAFFEVNFTANDHAKNVPSLGLKAGYKRKENTNYIVGQPYVTMKFFLNHQTAFFASLAPYYRYKLEGEKGEWGVEIPTGLRFYFY